MDLNTKIRESLKELLTLRNIFNNKYPLEKQAELLLKIAKRGWYVNGQSFTLGAYVSLVDLSDHDETNLIDEIFCDIYRGELPEFFERFAKIYPGAKHILSEIEQCVNHQLYSGAITLLLTFSEYVANYQTSKNKGKKYDHILFNRVRLKDKSKPAINGFIPHYGDAIKTLSKFPYLSVLLEDHALNIVEKRSIAGILNRHSILHGIDLNYGSEINFLKMLSFIDFLDCVLRTIAREQKD